MPQDASAIFEELLLKAPKIRYPKEGELVKWSVIRVERKTILITVNDQFTWIISWKELWNTVDLSTLKFDDEIEAVVLWDSEAKWLLILSLKKANQIKSLSNLSDQFQTGEIISVKPYEANKWGLLIDIDGLKWFIPVSQLTPLHYPRVEWADPDKILRHLQWLIWVDFTVRVINVDEDWKKIIFSEKAAIEETRQSALKTLKVGDKVDWTVSWILSYGLFITFQGLEWLVHVSEIDWWHVNNPSKFAEIWQQVKVLIIWMNEEKISLSMKRLKPNPWDVLAGKYKVHDTIKAPVSRISQFGAFLELEWGIQWLIHLSEISSWVVKDIRNFVKIWEEVEAKIINFEPKEKRIWLSLKALNPEPPKEAKKEKSEVTVEEEKKGEKRLKK